MGKVGILLLAVAIVTLVQSDSFPSSASIPTSVSLSLAKNGQVDVFLTFLPRPTSVLNTLQLLTLSRDDRLNSVARTLKENAAKSQKSLLAFLVGKPSITAKSFWISNQILVKNVDSELLHVLAAIPEVEEIQESGSIPLEEPIDLKIVEKTSGVEWGIEIIGAESVWAAGNNGSGIVVANIDTGVRYTHRTLIGSWVGKEYGWLDPSGENEFPIDEHGHGTHTMGTIVGSEGIGVAPGATWMTCRGCTSVGCAFEYLLACGEFILCPTLSDGSNPDCSKAPHIVSNSWGGTGGRPFYDDVVQAWSAAGIIPVFANGNLGVYGCSSVGSPADTNSAIAKVIGVGSTTQAETLSPFSSLGSSVYGDIKPDIAAPGSNVISAFHTSDDAFAASSGTSMAAPHVAGVLALILNAHPNYSFEQATQVLYGGATHTVGSTDGSCGGIPQDVYPNNYVGHGRLSASGSLLSKD